MTLFSYKAQTADNKIISGTIEAETRQHAARLLVSDNLQPLSLQPVKKSFLKELPSFRSFSLRHHFPVIFSRQMAAMLAAGLSISDALQILADQEQKSSQGKILAALSVDVNNGTPLSQAMRKLSKIFSPTVTSLVAAGEASGSLDTIFTRLAKYLETTSAVTEKLITVMIYPFILLFSAMFSAVLIITFVLPSFVSLFESFHTPLPLPTRILLGTSLFLKNHGDFLLIVLFLLLLAFRWFYQQRRYRLFLDHIRLKIPILGNFFVTGEFLKITSTLAVLLSSGIVIDKAVSLVSTLTENEYLRQLLQQTHANIQKGYPLSETLRHANIFPPTYIGMLGVGEATGDIDTVLDTIADDCRLNLETSYERLNRIAEPVIVLIVAAFIVPLVLAVALPILETITIFT